MSREEKWFRRLRCVLRDMPDDVELLVHHGCIELAEAGARLAEVDRCGNADNTPTIDTFETDRVYPCGESM